MKVIFSLFLTLLTIFSITYSKQLSVGVAPPYIDLGTLEAGSEKNVRFYVVSSSPEEMLIELENNNGNLDFFRGNMKYLQNLSQENTKDWIKYYKKSIILTNQTEPLETAIGKIKNYREVEFLLSIPKNAEPGYHLIEIMPIVKPEPANLGQIGAIITTSTPIHILFFVNGTAIRDGKVLDVLGKGNTLEIYFKNVGTTTIVARASGTLFDGNNTINFTSPFETLKPNEVKKLIGFLPKSLEGDYKVELKVDITSKVIEYNSIVRFEALPIAKKEEAIDLTTYILIISILLFLIIILYGKKKSKEEK